MKHFLLFCGLLPGFILSAQTSQPNGQSLALQQGATSLFKDSTDNNNGNPWSLQQCIMYAQQHNISVQQQMLNVQLSQSNLRQSQGNFLPGINGYASHTYQYGRTVDRFTNTFANSQVLSENYYISGNLTLFNGLQNYNSLKQNQYSLQSSQFQVQQTENDIALSVANAYLQVLYAQEQLDVAQQQATITQAQVDRTQKLVDAGASARGNLLDLQSQLASEQLTVVTAQSTLTISYLSLTQLMNLDSTAGFAIVKPDLNVPNETLLSLSADQIFQAAAGNQPGIKKAQTDLLSASKSVDVAYGALSPTITLQGSLGTGYSGAAKSIASSSYGIDTIGYTTGGDYVLYPTTNNTYVTTPFKDQFSNNFNKSFGVQINVPIFNRFQVNSAVAKAKIQRQNAQLSLDLSRQQLFKNIQQAYTDAQGALLKYQAAKKAVDAAQESFNYSNEKFTVGAATSVDFSTAQNKLIKAQSDLLQAKYEYIFRLKVLDYYQGKPLTF